MYTAFQAKSTLPTKKRKMFLHLNTCFFIVDYLQKRSLVLECNCTNYTQLLQGQNGKTPKKHNLPIDEANKKLRSRQPAARAA